MSLQFARSRFSACRRLPAVPLLLAFMGLVTAGFYASYAGGVVNTVTLPIRVYAPNGTDVHVESVTLHVSDASGVDRLYVQAHQPFYHRGGVAQGVEEGFDPEAAAEIRVNGGPWVEVRDENVTCAFPESSYDCVAGVYSTIRFAVPVSNIQSGPNTVEFKYNGTDGIRSGYRVLKVGLMRGGDDLQNFDPLTDSAADGTTLQYEDFSAWTPPLPDPSDIAAGEDLFTQEGLLVADGDSQTPIQAACSSCHARDGRDLKYFAYSNRVIEARSRYHGLTQQQAEQIASYIRSIQLRKRSGEIYEAPGTPWDPPYQPGPTGFGPEEQHPDSADVVYWAAGAGLENVLDRNIEMLPFLFPDDPRHPSDAGVDRFPNGDLNWHRISADSVLNRRALPVDTQFPDWNNWLPDIHPLDIPGANFNSSESKAHFENDLQAALDAWDGDPQSTDALEDIVTEWKRFHIAFKDDGYAHLSDPSSFTANEAVLASFSLFQWKAVRGWEVFHGSHLEDVADEMYCDHPEKPFCEPRAWPGRDRIIFALAPHLHEAQGQPPFSYVDAPMNYVMSNLWYDLQVIINPGSQPGSTVQRPVDWGYQRGHSTNTGVYYGVGASLRVLASEVKVQQILSNGFGVDGSGGNGYDESGFRRAWTPFQTTPAPIMQMYKTDQSKKGRAYNNLTHSQRTDLVEAFLRSWWDYNSRFPVDEFPRGDRNGLYEPPSVTQSLDERYGIKVRTDGFLFKELNAVNERLEVSPGVLDSIATWGGDMWPYTANPSWDELIGGSSPGDPIASITNLFNGNTFTAPVSLTIEADAYDPDGGSVSHVTFFADSTELGEDTSAPYRFTWQDISPGQYVLSARAVDDQGHSGSSSPVSVVVQEGTETSQNMTLEEGWNFISSRVHPHAPGLDSVFADTPELAVVQDGTGRTYVPGEPNNALREWSALESYLVLMQESDTLQVEGLSGPCETTPVPLQKGWNFISYLCEDPMPPEEALATIADELVMVKDGAGNVYLPGQNVDRIGMLEPGQGYKAFVSEDATLFYPAPPQGSNSSNGGQQPASSSAHR